MRQQLQPTIQLLSQCADQLDRLHSETGEPFYLQQLEQVRALMIQIKQQILRHEGRDPR